MAETYAVCVQVVVNGQSSVKWSDDYATGIQFIDEQHRQIFKWSEVFRAALDEGLGGEAYSELIYNLKFYAVNHFGFAEQCMKESRCPIAQRDKDAHVWFTETLSEFQQRYDVSGYDRKDAQRLADIIDEWLTDHICRIHMHLKRRLNK